MIQLSDRAIVEIERLQSQQAAARPYFRVGVRDDGCAGLAYELQFAIQAQPEDHQLTIAQLAILVDPNSAPQLQGLAIDYTEDLMGGGFQFSNPQAKRTCSCGVSFAISNDNTDEWTVDCGL
jgi:iron-sulfur cluster assembly protein